MRISQVVETVLVNSRTVKKTTQYEVIRSLGKHEQLIRLTTTPQSRKKFDDVPQTIEARLLSKPIKGKEVNILCSLYHLDAFREL